MRISRSEFFQLVAGGSAWLVSSGFARQIRPAVPGCGPSAAADRGPSHRRTAEAGAGYERRLPALARSGSHAGVLSHACRAGAEGAGLYRMGCGRPAVDRAYRRPPSLGGEPHVGRHRRCALQAARRLHRRRTESRAGQAGRRLRRRAPGSARGVRRGLEGQHQVGQLRSQRAVVAVVHAAQDVRRFARRLSAHRQPDGARDRREIRAVGRARISRR